MGLSTSKYITNYFPIGTRKLIKFVLFFVWFKIKLLKKIHGNGVFEEMTMTKAQLVYAPVCICTTSQIALSITTYCISASESIVCGICSYICVGFAWWRKWERMAMILNIQTKHLFKVLRVCYKCMRCCTLHNNASTSTSFTSLLFVKWCCHVKCMLNEIFQLMWERKEEKRFFIKQKCFGDNWHGVL